MAQGRNQGRRNGEDLRIRARKGYFAPYKTPSKHELSVTARLDSSP